MDAFYKKTICLSMGLFLSYSAFAGIGDREPFFRMTRVACIEDNKPQSYDRLFCASLSWFVNENDFQARINKCANLDPKGRTTIGEYLNSLNCESRYIDDLKNKLKRDGHNIQGRTVTGLTALFLDSDNVMGTARVFHDTIRKYRKMGKENGYKELKEFATVLNRK